MFRFFRLLRIRLIKEGNLQRYLLYAIGEIILVVLGILIALQVNTWNQGRINRNLEQVFLNRIHEDLGEDLKKFNAQLEYGRAGLEALKEAIILIHQENKEDDIFKFNELYDLAWLDAVNPQYSTYLELESTGRLNLIQNENLRLAILSHYAYYKRMETAFDRTYKWHKTITRGMDAETNILKYVTSAKNIFPPEYRSESDWSYMNDPEHPHFQMTEIAVGSISWWLNDSIGIYSEIIPKIQDLKGKIAKGLKE